MWVGQLSLNDEELEQARQEIMYKQQFALAWIKSPNNPALAAASVFPLNPHKAAWVAVYWINDPYVLAVKAQHLVTPDASMPSKFAIVAKALEIADNSYASNAEKLKALTLIAQIQGWASSGNSQPAEVAHQQNEVQKVLEVPLRSDMNVWEAIAVGHQDKLTTYEVTSSE